MIKRRPGPQLGQLPFELPAIRDFSKPSVMLHKNGRHLLFKPADPMAAMILSEVITRIDAVPEMRNGSFWHVNTNGEKVVVKDWKKVQIWKHLAGNISQHPICKILQQQGVEVGVVPTLANYIKKEYRRFQIEGVSFPVPAISGDSSLFERCSTGTTLRCTKDFLDPTYTDIEVKVFQAGKRYIVVDAGGEGLDVVKIATQEVADGASFTASSDVYEWTDFGTPMEEYFDDSEESDLGPTVSEAFPEVYKQRLAELDKRGFDLFEHVRIDAAAEAMKRASINGKLMRMGKTSEALAVTSLWGSEKIGVFGSQNVCLAWEKECKRLGIKDYVFVDKLSDLEKPGRIYLMRYGWIRQEKDRTASERKNHTNYLRSGERTHQVRLLGSSKSTNGRYSVLRHHACPHCEQTMVRPVKLTDSTGKIYCVEWTPVYGYMCRNQECSWVTDNRKKSGAAWSQKGNKLIRHKPGTYVDWGLAAHANCSHTKVRGRKCMECGETDGVWVPQLSKRFKKHFTALAPDEAHNMKDPTSQTYKAISRMRARRKYPMTGTFVSNGPMDTFWIMLWAFGGPCNAFPYAQVGGSQEFEKRFCQHVTLERPAGIDEETGEILKKTVSKRLPFLKNAADWWRFISPKFLRRNYNDPLYLESLAKAGMFKPGVEIKTLKCPMTPAQIKLMLSAMRDFKDVYEKYKEEAEKQNKEINKAIVIRQMSTMCSIATVPEVMNEKFGFQVYDGPAGGGKMYPITTLVKSKVLAGGKVVILSDYLAMQKAVEDELTRLGYGVLRFKTSWGADKRREAMEEFAENPDKVVMIAGTRAVSESVDFSVADTCVCCDMLWAPAFQQQAWSRILQATKRMRNCEIFLAVSSNSLDEHKFETFYGKLKASEQSQDRAMVTRRAMTVDIRAFVERVIEEEATLMMQMRDLGFEAEEFYAPDLNADLFEERFV